VFGQGQNVDGSLAKRRKLDAHHVETVIEILAKAALGHRLLEVYVGPRDETTPYGTLDCGAHTSHCTALQ
jgi:hypothetical protein